MSKWVQELENRQLLTAVVAVLTSDVASVNANIAATKAAVASNKSAMMAAQSGLSHDIKSSSTSANRASNQRLLAAALRAENSANASITRAENTLLTNAKTVSTRALADGKALLAHPTKSANQTKVSKDIAALNSIITAKLGVLQTALAGALAGVNSAFSNIAVANPSLASVIATDVSTIAAKNAAVGTTAAAVQTATTKLATDLGNQPAVVATLTGATFFRSDSTGNNDGANSGVIDYGAWTSGLDVQNVPGNYAAEFFISKVANPTAADFLSPAQLAASLTAGDNKFYFWADGDDTRGGSETFGLNLFINGSSTPTLSGYTIPGAGQTLNADSASTTSNINLQVVPGSGTLSSSAGSAGTISLSSFVVLGVSGQGSTVDLVNSTNTSPFTPPPQPDGVMDTYGTFTITVS